MKNIIILLVVLCTKFASAQCVNNVSTNPLNPTNSALPDNGIIILPDNTFDNQYLNRFDWFPVSNGYYSNYVPNNLSYAGITIGSLSNIMNGQNTPPYYNYIYDGPLPTGKNGWELLLLNLGRFPNNDPITNAEGRKDEVPYIVLYNKYSGIVRVFVAFGVAGQGADAVDITLSFDNTEDVSGNLRLNNGMDQALEQKTNVSLVKSIAKDPNLSTNWMSTDFQVAYDPCVCYYPSKLRIAVKKVYQSFLEAVSGSVSLPNQPLVGNNNIVNPLNFLAGINYNAETSKNGVMVYKAMSNMIDNYITNYEDYNKKLITANEHNKYVKTNLAMLKVAKYIGVLVATGVTLGGTPLFIQNGEIPMEAVQDYAFLESTSAESAEYQEMFEGVEDYQQNQLNLDFFKVASKKYNSFLTSAGKIKIETVFDIASKIFGEKMETFINQNFVTKELPVKPSMPTATFTETKFSGQITNYGDTYGPLFFTPGTFKNQQTDAPTSVTSPYEYPIYNESLGIFALLNTPKITLSKTIKNDSLIQNIIPQDPLDFNEFPTLYEHYQSWTNNYQFKLAEPLSYYFNPALDIESHDVKISLIIKGKKKLVQNSVNSQFIKNCFVDPKFSVNVESSNTNLNKYSPINSISSYKNGTNYSAFGISNNLPNQIDIDIIELITPYFSTDNFYSVASSFGLKNEIMKLFSSQYSTPQNPMLIGYDLDFEIYLKVLVNVKFNTLGEGNKPNTTTLLLTYKVPNDVNHVELVSTEIVPNLENSVNNITQYEENLTFKDVIFNGAEVKNCTLNGNVYTCQAWNDIRVFGNLSTANGYTANLIAGNQIETSPESIISPEITLSIVPILNSSQPMTEATSTNVESFCKKINPNGNNYMGNIINKIIEDSVSQSSNNQINQTDLSNYEAETALDFQLFPNPSSQLTTVIVEGNESSVTSINILDVMGKEQNLLIEGQNSQFNFDVSSLAKGMYFVKVNTSGASKTKQLIVK